MMWYTTVTADCEKDNVSFSITLKYVGNIHFSLKLTCHDNKFNSSSKHNPDVVIHTHIYLAAKTPASWESEGMFEITSLG